MCCTSRRSSAGACPRTTSPTLTKPFRFRPRCSRTSSSGRLHSVEPRCWTTTKLPVGRVRNKAGKFITPALESITAAAAGAMQAMGPNTDFRVSLTNPDGEKAYPIASFTWFLLRKDYDDAAKASALVKFVWWAETEGQAKAEPLGDAPLPKQLRPWIEARLKTISAGGKPVWTTAAR